MSDPQFVLPPAGWYPDPSGAPQQRWWDGRGWTVHYQGAATAPAAPVAIVAPASAPVQVPTRTAVYQPAQPAAAAQGSPAGTASAASPLQTVSVVTQAAISPASASAPGAVAPTATGFDFSFGGVAGHAVSPEASAEPFGITNFAGLGQTPTASVLSYSEAPTTWSTRSGWLLALLPLLQLAITGGMFYLWINVGLAPIAVLLLMLLPAVLALAAAISDQRKLRELGFDRAPAWGWIFLGVWLYLILRAVATRREMGAGAALIWVWLGCSIIASAAGTAATLYFSTLFAA